MNKILIKLILLFLIATAIFAQEEQAQETEKVEQTEGTQATTDEKAQETTEQTQETTEQTQETTEEMKIIDEEEWEKQLGEYKSIFNWDNIRKKIQSLLESFTDNIKYINFNEINFKKYLINIEGITFQDFKITSFEDLLQIRHSISQDHEMEILNIKLDDFKIIIHTSIKDVHIKFKNTWLQFFFTFVEDWDTSMVHDLRVSYEDFEIEMFGASILLKLIDKESIKEKVLQMAQSQASNIGYELRKNHEQLKKFFLDTTEYENYESLTIPKILDALHELDSHIAYNEKKKTIDFTMNLEKAGQDTQETENEIEEKDEF